MFIELTNESSDQVKGKKILINTNIIDAIYEGLDENGKSATFIFSHAIGQTWRVKETVAEVAGLINEK